MVAAATAIVLSEALLPASAQPQLPPGAPVSEAASASLPTLAALDFELVDDQDNPATAPATQRRVTEATAQLREELSENRLYRLQNLQPADALLARLRAQQAYLYRCNDCAAQVGKLLGVDLVMVSWVQKVSELILNVNVQIYDVAAGRVVFSKSVDLRGNTDTSWRRAVHYLVRDMAQKRAVDPGYGR